MIRVNLLPQKRAKRVAAGGPTGGGRELMLGIGALVAAAALVFFIFDQPKRGRVHDLQAANDELGKDIAAKNKQLVGYPALKKEVDEAKTRERSINRLISTNVIPANLLHELGEILTSSHLPTETDAMKRKLGPTSDLRFDLAWDPTHVWLTGFADTAGAFRLDGGAQAESDITQLQKRLQASAYFDDVALSTESRITDKTTGLAYYIFTITGKVAY